MAKGCWGNYLNTLSPEERSDYYDKNVAFWRSVNAKYPSTRNKAQLSRMKTLRRKEMQKHDKI